MEISEDKQYSKYEICDEWDKIQKHTSLLFSVGGLNCTKYFIC